MPTETLVTCPDCGQKNITPRGLAPHRKSKHCLNARPASKALVVAGTKPLTLAQLDVMPAEPKKARGLNEMTLGELEAADRGLRALPERLEKMSGIAAVLNGLVLTEIKSRCAHKEWTPWLQKNYGKTARDAQRRMKIAAAFSKNDTRVAFEAQQLTLSLLDDTQSGALDLNHPVVMAVEKWADGRSYRQLLEDETSDGRESNPGGFRPNALILNAWLKQEYPDNPEYRETEVFTDLPKEVQERFKKEGKRYEERLTKEQRAEIEREAEAQDWLERAPGFLSVGMDHGLEDFATREQLQALANLASDYAKQLNRKLAARSATKGAK